MDASLVLPANFLPVVLISVILYLLWISRSKDRGLYKKLPPGPTPAPVVGNFLQVFVKEPSKYYLELSKKYGSVFTVWYGSSPVVVISGYQTLKDSMIGMGEEFSGRQNYPLLLKVTDGFGVLVSSGDRWKQLRRFCISTIKNFGMGRRSIENKVKEEAQCLVQNIHTFGDSVFNPKDWISDAVSNVICSIMFGHRFESNDPEFRFLIKTVDAYFQFLSSPLGQAYNVFPKLVGFFSRQLNKLLADMEKLKTYFKLETAARTKSLDPSSPPQDFIEAFLMRKEEEKLNSKTEFNLSNLVTTIWNMISAGTETTSSTIRQGLLLMMKHPDIQARVQNEIQAVVGPDRYPSIEDRINMPFTDAVIHEIMRSSDLVPMSVPHKTLCDVEFKNFFIPKGTTIVPLLSSVLSDPKQWKNPDHFDPENFLDEDGRFKKNDAFVAFGIGKRACLGEALGRVVSFIIFTSLLQRFTFKATQPPEEVDTTPVLCSFGRLARSYECCVVSRV